MASYKMTADTKEKEKIIGGLLDAATAMWLVGGLAAGLGGFVLTFVITKILALGIIVCLVNVGIFIPFAFVKKRDLSLFEYFKRKRKLKRTNPVLVNKTIIKTKEGEG